MKALTLSFFEASLAVVALVTGASLGGCNGGDIPIDTLETPQAQVSGTSHTHCPKGQGRAPGDVNTQTDPNNCGGCGVKCPSGDTCIAGVCTGTSTCTDSIQNGNESDVDCGGSCPPCASGKACNTTSDCVSGDVCNAGICQPTSTCTGAMCGSACVDTQTDPNNCGSCGAVCLPGTTCTAGACLCQGQICAGACVNLNSDPHNCGACGNACPSGDTCVSGTCAP